MEQDVIEEFKEWWYESIAWMSTLTSVEYLS